MSEETKKAMAAAERAAVKVPKLAVPKLTPPASRPTSALTGSVARSLAPKQDEQAKQVMVVEDDWGKDEAGQPVKLDIAYKFAFIGTGQGGGNLAASFWRLGYRRVGIINTSDTDFGDIEKEMPDLPKLSFKIGGAAKDMELARTQFMARSEEVWDLLVRAWGSDPEYIFVCAGLGGGTGSGTVVPLINLARKYMEARGKPPKVGVLVSFPQIDEGQKICRNAVQGFREILEAKASPVLIIDNARINTVYKPGLLKLYGKANEVVSGLLHVFNNLAATRSTLTSFDQAELAQLLDGGVCMLASADIDAPHSPADISTAIREKLANSVLAACDLRRGRKAGCLFVADEETLNRLPSDYFAAGFTQLDRILGSGYTDRDKNPPVVHRGVYVGSEPGIQCYVMISELEPPIIRMSEMAKVAGLDVKGVTSALAQYLGIQD